METITQVKKTSHPVSAFYRRNLGASSGFEVTHTRHKKKRLQRLQTQSLNKFHPQSAEIPKETKIWISKSKPAREIARTQAKELVKRISFTNFNYSDSPITPGLQSYSALAELVVRQKLYLNVPDTIINGYGFEQQSYMYTDHTGLVKIVPLRSIFKMDIVNHILDKHRSSNHIPGPLAMIKAPNSSFHRPLMTKPEFKMESKQVFKNDIIIQRYVLPKGRKACKVRVIWNDGNIDIYKVTNKMRLDGKNDHVPAESVLNNCPNFNEAHKIYGKANMPLTNHVKIPKQEESKPHSEKEERRSLSQKELPMSHGVVPALESVPEFFKKTAKMDEYMKEERNLKGKLRDLGDFNVELRKKKEFTESKKVKQPATAQEELTQLVQSPEEEQHNKADSLQNYLEQSMSHSSPNLSLKVLYKELASTKVNKEDEEDLLQEEVPISSIMSNKLRLLFCTNTNDYEQSVIYKAKTNRGYERAISQLLHLRKAIDAFIMMPSNKKLTWLVLDFIETPAGEFYVYKIKGFKFKRFIINPLPFDVHLNGKPFECPGGYCSSIDKRSLLNLNETLLKIKVEEITKTNNNSNKKQKQEQKETQKYFVMKKLLIGRTAHESLDTKIFEKVQVCKNCYLHFKGNSRKNQREDETKQTDYLTESLCLPPNTACKVIEEINPTLPQDITKKDSTHISTPISTKVKRSASEVKVRNSTSKKKK